MDRCFFQVAKARLFQGKQNQPLWLQIATKNWLLVDSDFFLTKDDLGKKSCQQESGWWFQSFFIFHFIYGMILPIDELHHFSEG